jgi:hypothetical protein
MNILILTPDAVGSTLLQRLITIYMQFHEYDRPVINLHELTNGIHSYYSPEFNREMLGKVGRPWGYHQSLTEIVDLLASVDHYKTSRLAQYHIQARQDSIEQQVPFYRYLDDNFFVIATRRRNLFEHALSWGINAVTKKLNVYTSQEKIDSFFNLYRDGVEVSVEQMSHRLDSYRDYLGWCDTNFSVGSYFYYEDHMPEIEKYILNLPIFAGQPRRVSWQSTFGIDFADWNRCHFFASDVGALALQQPEQMQRIGMVAEQQADWAEEGALVPLDLFNSALPVAHREFVTAVSRPYAAATQAINDMVNLKILTGTVPIKKQTLTQKLAMIRNVDQCIDAYNSWVAVNPGLADPVTRDSLAARMHTENTVWDPARALTAATVAPLALPPTQL